MSISQNSALFALLGTYFGGDGVSTFSLPNLQGRVPIGQGQGLGLSDYVMGQAGGTEDVTITFQEMPSHTHAAQASTNGNTDSPVNSYPGTDPAGNDAQYAISAANAMMAPTAVGNAGGNVPHSNLQPVAVLSYIIALTGIFPTRN